MPLLRRLLGVALLGAALLPLHRLLDPGRTGLAGSATRRVAEQAWAAGLWGTLLVVGAAAALAIAWRRDPGPALARGASALGRVPALPFALGCGTLAAALAAAASLVLFGGRPTSVDEMVQLLHARALLEGGLALPLPADPAAWMVQNSWLTPSGWASVYPPFHTLLLAAGVAAGVPWLVGPVATGAGIAVLARAADRLLPHRPGAARAGVLLAALSPFVALLGGSYLSHTTAAALAAATLWAALRARDGGAGWALATGLAVGAFVGTRPWTGLALSTALLASVWLPEARRQGPGWALGRGGALVAGGLPFAALLLGWSQALFGHPLRLGYSAAFGPAHGLGLHDDPWGNAYGFVEAVGYTGADLVLLGGALLESPLPALLLIGVGLVLAPGRGKGSAPLLAWALAGVGANALYWHHGLHLGPRLLYETAPAWILLWTLAAADLLAAVAMGGAARLRRGVAWVVVLSLLGGAASAPGRVRASADDAVAGAALPTPPATPALVFAHGSWAGRVSARLTAAGMRRDSVETALRRNDLCLVDAYSRWRAGGSEAAPPELDLMPRPGVAPGLAPVTLSPGNVAWLRPGASLEGGCLREARADRVGSVELEPLLWEAPPVPGAAVTLARDLGPVDNAAVLARFPGAHPFLLVEDGGAGGVRLLPYDEGMEWVWGGAGGAARPDPAPVTSGGG